MKLSPEESAVLSRLPEKYRSITRENIIRMTVRERKEWLVRQRIVMGCEEAIQASEQGSYHPLLNQRMERTVQRLVCQSTSVNPPLPGWLAEERRRKRAEDWRRYHEEHGAPEIKIPTSNTPGRGGFGD